MPAEVTRPQFEAWIERYRSNPRSGAPDWDIDELRVDGVRVWTIDEAAMATVDDVVTRRAAEAEHEASWNRMVRGALIGGGITTAIAAASFLLGDPRGALVAIPAGILCGAIGAALTANGSEVRGRVFAQARRDGTDERIEAVTRRLEAEGYSVDVSSAPDERMGEIRSTLHGESIYEKLEDRARDLWWDTIQASRPPRNDDLVEDWYG